MLISDILVENQDQNPKDDTSQEKKKPNREVAVMTKYLNYLRKGLGDGTGSGNKP